MPIYILLLLLELMIHWTGLEICRQDFCSFIAVWLGDRDRFYNYLQYLLLQYSDTQNERLIFLKFHLFLNKFIIQMKLKQEIQN